MKASRGFIGRTRELLLINQFIKSSNLVSIVGMGGLGKTRLAGEATRRAPLIALNNVRSAAELIDALRQSLELNLPSAVRSGGDQLPIIAEHVPELLVLDNAEQLEPGAVDLLEKLLSLSPGKRILVTSRRELEIPGELVLHLAPLTERDSRRLAAHLLRKAGKGAGPVPQEILATGSPLEIELAVYRGTIAALPLPQQRLLAGLGVFAHSWSLADAEGVLGNVNRLDYDQLVDVHLVRAIPGTGRWRMTLPPVRDYARALGTSKDLAAAYAAHFEAEALRGDPTILEPAAPELVAAMEWLQATAEHERAARIAVALWPWMRKSGRLDTAEQWLKGAGTAELPQRLAAEVVDSLGRLLLAGGRYSEALVPLIRARDFWEEEGNLPLVGRAAGNLSTCCRYQGDLVAAKRHCLRAIEIFEHQADARRLSAAKGNLGQIEGEAGNLEEAVQLQREALALDPEEADRARRHVNLSETYLLLGKRQEAITALEAALRLSPPRYEQAKAEVLLALLADSSDLTKVWTECRSLGTASPFWKETIELIESKTR